VSNKIEKIVLNWIFPLLIILSFFDYSNFNYYFLGMSLVIYVWKNFPLNIVLNLSYLIITLLTSIPSLSAINMLIIIILLQISKNSSPMRIISYITAMAIYYNFMMNINFIISIITLAGILIFSYVKEKKKIFLYLLIPVLLLSFFNENFIIFNSLEKQNLTQEEVVEEKFLPESNKNNVQENKNIPEETNSSKNNISISNQGEYQSSQEPQDLMIYQSLILLVALFTLLWIFFYHKMYENRKALIYSAISIFFVILSIFTILAFDFNDLKPYSPDDGTGLTQEKIESNLIYRTILKAQDNIDNIDDYANLSFEEKTSALKIIENIIRYYLLTTLVVLSVIVFFIIRSKRAKPKDQKTKKEIEKEKKEVYNKEGIYLIDGGYKFIRNNFYSEYSFLTPYELLETVPVSSEFKELTDLFVQKEYGTKEIDYSDKQIKKLIDKIIIQMEDLY